MVAVAADDGARRAAGLLIALGTTSAGRLLARMAPDAVERIAGELLHMPQLDSDVRDAILEEAYAGVFREVGVLAGGETYALQVFAEAFGEARAHDLLDKVREAQQSQPFEFLRVVDPIQVAEFLSTEHPQTIALVVAHLDARRAAGILTQLDAAMQVEVAQRLALMEQTTPEMIALVEDGLRRRLSSLVTETTAVGGVKPLAHVLNQVDRTTERQILGGLAEHSPDLADAVRRLMFVFEDVVKLDDRAMQKVVRNVDTKDLALALRNASDGVRQKFMGNMSQRAAEMLTEEMSLTTQVRLKNVEEAQQRIVDVIKHLEETDEIVIDRGDGSDALI